MCSKVVEILVTVRTAHMTSTRSSGLVRTLRIVLLAVILLGCAHLPLRLVGVRELRRLAAAARATFSLVHRGFVGVGVGRVHNDLCEQMA